jgi:potassium/hydrogen antiporter
MTNTIIITFCVLLLIAYLFDLTSSRTRIPSVILLLFLGWVVKQLTLFFNIHIPDFSPVLPVLGSIGLILIVIEGALELELNRSKLLLIIKSFLGAFLPMIGSAFVLAYLFMYFGHYSLRDSLINAVPFCIMSSAIAIPSVRNLSSHNKEFIIYESSFSDILGVLFFNFLMLNDNFGGSSFSHFGIQVLIIFFVSFIATIGLAILLRRIEHHIKFIPIILLIILIYEVSKVYHLPGLIFILMFGLFIGNLDELKHIKWIQRINPDILSREVIKFKELTIEAAFIVRALFFLLFGYLIATSEILNTQSMIWTLVIVAIIFFFRIVQLIVSNLPFSPLLFIAPRGLITILLFLSIAPQNTIGLVNNSLIIQVIILTAFIMMIGLMTTRKKKVTSNEIISH